ncbi:MAG: hypothetical protein B7C54_11515 [Acidimicrobiales bacterium mtb01]|nr:CoA transferase [Actinomycetota bacterium]TEX45675.1 MAG: hypothetical protein B7C54_11515 [Acidimicrobiales bacterium mtb01]
MMTGGWTESVTSADTADVSGVVPRASAAAPGLPPLEGTTVVSVEQAIAIPFASRQLADLGATVLKVERPLTGDFARSYDRNVGGQSAFFVWANRGKHSIELDIKGQRDRLEELISEADVYLHNLSPTAARRLGLDAESVHARHPKIVACEVSGYGRGGPRSDDTAYDLAVQAEAGVFDVCGDGDLRCKVGFSVADIAAGMYALSSVLACLARRHRTGEGAVVSVSMLDALAEWMSAPLLQAQAVGSTSARSARRHFAISPYGTFRLADSSEVLIAVQNDAEWRRFCAEVLEDARLADDARFRSNADRIARVDELEELVQGLLLSRGAGEVRKALSAASIANARLNSLNDVWHHEQLRTRKRFVPTELPGGHLVETLHHPFDIDGARLERSWVPAVGEDRREQRT